MNHLRVVEQARPFSEIKACHMSLYPTKDSLVEAVEYIESQAPYSPEDIFPLLMLYHNSLIKALADGT